MISEISVATSRASPWTGRLFTRAVARTFSSPSRVLRFKTQQVKKAQEKLKKNRGLLEQQKCQVVQVPDSGLLVILLGVNHIEIESVKAVQEIIQSMDPDAVCVELCDARVKRAGLLEEARSIRGSSRAFLRQDMAKELRKHSSDGARSPQMGIEMMMAFLEAYRFLKPCYLVDRDIHITNARYKAAQGPGMWRRLHRRFPRVAKILGLIRLFLAGKETGRGLGMPERKLLRMFHRGLLDIPWVLRREILETAWLCELNGEKMVPHESLRQIFDYEFIQDKMLGQPPMPPELVDWLGPESEYDVFHRVIAFERDVIIARNIRSIHQTSVEYAPGGLNGPLVLATLGKAHIPGVAHHLTLPFSKLDRIIAETKADVV